MPSPSEENFVLASTVADVLRRAASSWPDRSALVVDEEGRTYSELLDGATRYAAAYRRAGVGRGDQVGLFSPASVDFYEALFGASMVGASVVPMNYRYRGDEIRYILEDSECVLVATSTRFAPDLDLVARLEEGVGNLDDPAARLGINAKLRGVVVLNEGRATGPLSNTFDLRDVSDAEREEIEREGWLIGLSELAILIYTSGTTARPKGVPLTHEALTRVSRAMCRRWEVRDDDALWNPLPTFHLGVLAPILACQWAGAKYVASSFFEPANAVVQLEAEQVSMLFSGFPKITSDIYDHETFAQADMSRIRWINVAAPPELLERTAAEFPDATVVTPYGLTEVVGAAAFGIPSDPPDLRLTSGKALEGVEIRVVDPETLDPMAPGDDGEIQVRTFAMMRGYHHDPGRTAEVFTIDGWLRTGDRGHLLASGHLKFTGRIKEMIKVGGENVAPLEIESVLLLHDAVQTASVAGIPDPQLIEVPVAWVELEPGAEATPEELIEYCRSRMARFKVPRELRIVTEWPMSATKIQKDRLVDGLLAEKEAATS